MEPADEIARLRRELAAWRAQGEMLARRVDALESEARRATSAADTARVAAPEPAPEPTAPPEPAIEPTPAPKPPPLPGVAARVDAPATGPEIPIAAAPPETPAPKPDGSAPAAPRPRPIFVEGPSLAERLGASLRRLGPAEEMSWEMALGSYWLPRAAMVLLAVGVLWLLGLGINRFAGSWWMPHARLALGYALCFGLLGWGWRLRESTPGFARVLLGGGFGLSYFVTFATHFLPFSRVFARPEPTLVLLGALTAAWVAVAHARNARWMALGVVAMGHGTVGLSTLTLNVPSPWAVAGVFALAVAGGWFLARRGWFAVAAVGMIGSYANHLFWMSQSPGSDRVLDYTLGLAVLAAYGALFALADWRAPADCRAAIGPRWRSAYAAFNAGAVLHLGTLLTQAFDFSAPRLHLFYFAAAAALLGLGFLYRRGASVDPLFHAYATKAGVVLTLGLATWLEGASLTLSLAIEAVALLETARRSGLIVSRLLALGVLALALGHGFATAPDLPRAAFGDDGFNGPAASAAVIALALFAFAVRWQRAAWQTPGAENLPAPLRALAHWTDSGPPSAPNRPRPLEGLLVSEFAALGAAALAVAHLARLATAHFGPVAMVVSLALVAAAVVLRARPLAHASWPLALIGWGVWHLNGLPAYVLDYGAPGHGARLLQALLVCVPLIAMAECARRAAPATWSRHPGVATALAYIYAAFAAEAFTAAAAVLAQPAHAPLLIAAAALAALAHAMRANAPAFVVFAGVAAVVAARMLQWTAYNGVSAPWALAAAAAFVAAVPFADSRLRGARPGICLLGHPLGQYLLPGVAAWAVLGVANGYAPTPWGPLALLAAGAAAAAAMARLNPAPLGWVAVALGCAALQAWFQVPRGEFPAAWHAQALLIVAGGIAADRWFSRVAAYPSRAPGAVAVAASWLAAMVYVVRAWSDENAMYVLVLVGAAFLVYGAAVRGATPALLGLLAAASGTAITVAMSYDESLPVAGLLVNYGVAIAFWFACERAVARMPSVVGPRAGLLRAARLVFTALPCVLLVVMVERLPVVGGAYLSIGWTVAALAMLGAGAATGHAHYRYAGLATFAIVLYRIVVIDSRGLDAVYRIAGMIFLGLVLLGVGYAYVRSREQARPAPPPPPGGDRDAEV